MKQDKPTQRQMFYMAARQSADINRQFLDMATGPNGITSAELALLIERRPALWKRFEGYMGRLPL